MKILMKLVERREIVVAINNEARVRLTFVTPLTNPEGKLTLFLTPDGAERLIRRWKFVNKGLQARGMFQNRLCDSLAISG